MNFTERKYKKNKLHKHVPNVKTLDVESVPDVSGGFETMKVVERVVDPNKDLVWNDFRIKTLIETGATDLLNGHPDLSVSNLQAATGVMDGLEELSNAVHGNGKNN